MRRTGLLLVTAALLAAGPVAARAVDTDALVAEVIRGAKTDAERASKLLAAAKIVNEQPEVMVVLLEKAADYCLRGARQPGAAKIALEALGLLEEKAPDKKGLWHDKRLELLRLQYRYATRTTKPKAGEALLDALLARAEELEEARQWAKAARLYYEAYSLAMQLKSLRKDEIVSRRARAVHLDRVVQQVERLKQVLSADAKRTVDRHKLVSLLLIELDDLDEAARNLTDDVDPAWRTYIPMAAKDPNALTEPEATELGRWYHKFLAPKASKYAKERVLCDAAACYERAIELHEAKDTGRMALELALRRIEEELDELIDASGQGSVVELLRFVDVTRDALYGFWRLTNKALTAYGVGRGYTALKLPVTLNGDYQLAVRFALGKGARRGQLAVTVPVGTTHATVVVGGGDGTEAGLEYVDGKPYKQNATFVKTSLVRQARVYQLDIAVSIKDDAATVIAELGNKQIIRWKGKTSSLSLSPGTQGQGTAVLRPAVPPVTFTSVRLSAVRGKAKLLPPPKKTEPSPVPVFPRSRDLRELLRSWPRRTRTRR